MILKNNNYFLKIKALALIVLTLALFGFFSNLALAEDSALTNAQTGLNTTATKAFGAKIPFQGKSIPQIIGLMIGYVLSFLGVIFLVLTIYAGLLWMTAQGNDQQVDKAKEILKNAIIGLIIVMAAYAITAFIGMALTGGGAVAT